MKYQTMNVITKSGKTAKGGEGLFGEELVQFCIAYMTKYGYSPKVVPTGQTVEIDEPVATPAPVETPVEDEKQIAVAKSTFAETALYCIRHHKAMNVNARYFKTDKETGVKTEYRNPYHWSGAMRHIISTGMPIGDQLTYLKKQYALVSSAVEILKGKGRTYPLIDTDDLDWSFGTAKK